MTKLKTKRPWGWIFLAWWFMGLALTFGWLYVDSLDEVAHYREVVFAPDKSTDYIQGDKAAMQAMFNMASNRLTMFKEAMDQCWTVPVVIVAITISDAKLVIDKLHMDVGERLIKHKELDKLEQELYKFVAICEEQAK